MGKPKGKTETTLAMEEILIDQFLHTHYCLLHKEVAIHEFNNEQRCDLMGFSKHYRELICIELKQSVSDFHSKARLTFIGYKNYYAMPYDVYEKVKNEIPSSIGVFVLPRENILKKNCEMFLIKKCKTNNKGIPNGYPSDRDYIQGTGTLKSDNYRLIELYWEMQNSIKTNLGMFDKLLNSKPLYDVFYLSRYDKKLYDWIKSIVPNQIVWECKDDTNEKKED